MSCGENFTHEAAWYMNRILNFGVAWRRTIAAHMSSRLVYQSEQDCGKNELAMEKFSFPMTERFDELTFLDYAVGVGLA